jgi:hypothetical protein
MLSVSEFDSRTRELLQWLMFLLIFLSTYTQILV